MIFWGAGFCCRYFRLLAHCLFLSRFPVRALRLFYSSVRRSQRQNALVYPWPNSVTIGRQFTWQRTIDVVIFGSVSLTSPEWPATPTDQSCIGSSWLNNMERRAVSPQYLSFCIVLLRGLTAKWSKRIVSAFVYVLPTTQLSVPVPVAVTSWSICDVFFAISVCLKFC